MAEALGAVGRLKDRKDESSNYPMGCWMTWSRRKGGSGGEQIREVGGRVNRSEWWNKKRKYDNYPVLQRGPQK